MWNGKAITQIQFWSDVMISVGIDVSKGKSTSTVCILKPYGEIVSEVFEVEHTDIALNES